MPYVMTHRPERRPSSEPYRPCDPGMQTLRRSKADAGVHPELKLTGPRSLYACPSFRRPDKHGHPCRGRSCRLDQPDQSHDIRLGHAGWAPQCAAVCKTDLGWCAVRRLKLACRRQFRRVEAQKGNSFGLRPKPLVLQLPPPLINMLPRHIVTPGNIGHGRTTNTNLSQNRQLHLIWPKPPTLDANNHLMSQNLPSPQTTSLSTSVNTSYKICSHGEAGGLNRAVTFDRQAMGAHRAFGSGQGGCGST